MEDCVVKSIILKTTCRGNHFNNTLDHPLDKPGKLQGESVQLRRIINIPKDVANHEVIRLFSHSCDATWLGGEPGRLDFDFSELDTGNILRS